MKVPLLQMTLQQYVNNVRGICKDGSSPDPLMLAGFYERVCRYEWQVEEREHMVIWKEGWLSKLSNNKVCAPHYREARPYQTARIRCPRCKLSL